MDVDELGSGCLLDPSDDIGSLGPVLLRPHHWRLSARHEALLTFLHLMNDSRFLLETLLLVVAHLGLLRLLPTSENIEQLVILGNGSPVS